MLLRELLNNISIVRTEFKSPDSVLENFVIPPFLSEINLHNFNHSIALVGSRGSGKTIYLKYFSHWSKFDIKAQPSESDLKSIILYWKPDTLVCRGISRGQVNENIANLFFENYLTIEISKEVLNLIKNVAHHFKSGINSEALNSFYEYILRAFRIDLKNEKSLHHEYIYDELNHLLNEYYNAALNSKEFNGISPSLFFPELFKKLKKIKIFNTSSFKIYIDEFENLTFNQQSFVNGLRKHSTSFVSWNVAYKAYAETSTLVALNSKNGEKLQQPNDYKEVNLDQVFNNEDVADIQSFFAKILMVSLFNSEFKDETSSECLRIAKKILTYKSSKDLITDYYTTNEKAYNRLIKDLNDMHEKIGDDYFSKIINQPSLAVALYVIKEQKSFDINILKEYLIGTLADKEVKKFEEKIRHYTNAGIYKLNINSTYTKIPIYSGFSRMITMSSYNIRNFLSLSSQSLILHFKSWDEEKKVVVEDLYDVSPSTMHKACIDTSVTMTKNVISFAPMGQRLNTLVVRLGEIFRIKHQQDPITEPEINHFGLLTNDLEGEMLRIVTQALCWNVLIALNATKEKNNIDTAKLDYQLNPIYSPAFGISINRKHKMTFSMKDFEMILKGSNSEWIEYRNSLEKKLSNSLNEYHKDLFGDL